MKDDLIRNLMSGIDDEFVDEYRASMDKKAAEIAAASGADNAAGTAVLAYLKYMKDKNHA